MNIVDEVEVILIEDNSADAELILRALKKQGLSHKVRIINDGSEALKELSDMDESIGREAVHTPKVILLDLSMPKVDGLQILEKIKSGINIRMIPVVVLTSSGNETDVEKCYRLGVNSYVIKPLGYEDLVQTMLDISNYWLILNLPPMF